MADYTNIAGATEDLDELIDVLEADIKKGGFENDDVIWMIKVWTKVTILAGLTNTLKAYWAMKRAPSKIAGKRSQALLRALEDYSKALENSNTKSGDFFHRANDAMLNFVWDYRQHISGKQEADFVHQIQVFMTLSTDKFMQETLTKMDQSL
jgi:hypothetical protein